MIKSFNEFSDTEIANAVREIRFAYVTWRETGQRMEEILDGDINMNAVAEYQRLKREHDTAWNTYYDTKTMLGIE